MTNKLHITKAEKTDLERILRLQKEAYLQEAQIYNDYTIQPLQQTIESVTDEWQQGIILKALIDGELVGSVRAVLTDGICYIGKLIVKKNVQNKGIGKRLLSEIEKYYKDAEIFELFTGHRSEKNLFIYRSFGYIDTRTQRLDDRITLLFLQKKNS